MKTNITKGPTKPTTYRIPPALKEQFLAQAAREDRSATKMLIVFIKEGLERRKRGRKAQEDGTVLS